MAQANRFEIERVLPDEETSRAEDPIELREQLILMVGRRHVMEHGEIRGRREVNCGQPCSCCIGNDHAHVGSSKALFQRRTERRIHFDCGQPIHALAQEIGGDPGSGADFENLVTQVACRLDPRQQFRLDHVRPLGTGQEFQMGRVHASARIVGGSG